MDELWQLTAREITEHIRAGDLSATDVTDAHLDRIDVVNPQINAIVQDCQAEARDAARAIDAALSRGESPGPLCGVPVTIKVNVDQQGHATTNGLRMLENLVAEQDNPVVSNLRKAGAVIVGRTNTPAFSMRWFTKNSLNGETLNPRNAQITPGGSSGGAAAAVAAGLCTLAHGTDIAGSVRYPAYACGLHGLRPTFGRVSAWNSSAPDRFIGAQLMAVSGPLARSIDDIDLALAAMSAADPRDPWHVPAPLEGAAFPKRATYCLAPDDMPVSDAVVSALLEAVEALRGAGWNVEEVASPPMRRAAAINGCLWMADTQFGARDMVEREGDPEAQFVFAQMSQEAGEVGFEDLMEALQARVGLVRAWSLFLQDSPVHLCPVSGELPFAQHLDVSSEAGFARVFEAQLPQRALPTLGLPALSVATGVREGCPVGVQLIGPKFREDILLAAGRDLEMAFGQAAPVTPAAS